jgi:hypothetical protein
VLVVEVRTEPTEITPHADEPDGATPDEYKLVVVHDFSRPGLRRFEGELGRGLIGGNYSRLFFDLLGGIMWIFREFSG